MGKFKKNIQYQNNLHFNETMILIYSLARRINYARLFPLAIDLPGTKICKKN